MRNVEVSVNGVSATTFYMTGTGQQMVTHSQANCRGVWCVIHRPMPGPWYSWPTHWRTDRGIMERICGHGVGHPAAEEYSLRPASTLDHGCCGCPCQSAPETSFIDGEWVETQKGIAA